jgi:hypothetical protein
MPGTEHRGSQGEPTQSKRENKMSPDRIDPVMEAVPPKFSVSGEDGNFQAVSVFRGLRKKEDFECKRRPFTG